MDDVNSAAAPSNYESVTAPVKATDISAGSTIQQPTAATQKPLTARWLDLNTFSHAQRYRNAFDNGGVHVFETGQQRSLLIGHFKLDAKDRYQIGFRASSGRYFNWAFGDYAGPTFTTTVAVEGKRNVHFTPAQLGEFFTALGTDPNGTNTLLHVQSAGWEFYPRELYFSATPVKALTVEVGSFGFQRGLATEITTFDDDGYLSGERFRIHNSKHLFFDQIGVTNACFCSFASPNAFNRTGDFKHSSYRQVFVEKRLNTRTAFSADYTWQFGTNTLREAGLLNIAESHVADNLRVELYQRLNTFNIQGLTIPKAAGVALTATKTIAKRLNVDLGYAKIDPDYTVYTNSRFFHSVAFSLNGDSYGIGKRVFAHVSYKLTPSVSAFGFYTHAVGANVMNLNQQGFSSGLNFDLKAMVNKGKLVF